MVVDEEWVGGCELAKGRKRVEAWMQMTSLGEEPWTRELGGLLCYFSGRVSE